MADWYSLDLSKSERAVLIAIWQAPNKSLGYRDLFEIAGKTARGARIVLNRLVDRSLLGRSEGAFSTLTITFKGMQALGVTRASQDAERGLCGAPGSLLGTGSTPVLSATQA